MKWREEEEVRRGGSDLRWKEGGEAGRKDEVR